MFARTNVLNMGVGGCSLNHIEYKTNFKPLNQIVINKITHIAHSIITKQNEILRSGMLKYDSIISKQI